MAVTAPQDQPFLKKKKIKKELESLLDLVQGIHRATLVNCSKALHTITIRAVNKLMISAQAN